MDTERNVTPLHKAGDDSWSAGSGARRKSGSRGGSAKIVVFGAVALIAVISLGFGTYKAGISRGDTAGHERGVAEGYASGHTAGFSEGRAEGFSSGREAGYDEGEAAGYTSGYSSGKSDGYTSGYTSGKRLGYADGYRDGASGGYGEGWTNGCLAVFTALGDDTAASWNDVDGVFDSTFVSTVDRYSCY